MTKHPFRGEETAIPEVDKRVGEYFLDLVENRQGMTTGFSVTGLRRRMLDPPRDGARIGIEGGRTGEAGGLRPKREPVIFCGSHRCL